MQLFKKKEQLKKEELKKEEVKAEIKYRDIDMTYTELVSQELNIKMNELTEKKKRIENNIREALENIRERGNDGDGLAKIISDLREKEKNIQNEIDKTSVEYKVDFNLEFIANKLDRIESENMGIDLLYSIAPKINEIISILDKVKKCYGLEGYCPSAYAITSGAIKGLVASLSNELPKLHKQSKEELLLQLNERMSIVEGNKKKIQEMKDKYNVL